MFHKHRHIVATLSYKQRLKPLETEFSTSGFSKDKFMLSMAERYVQSRFCVGSVFLCFACLRPMSCVPNVASVFSIPTSKLYSRDIASACRQSYANMHVIMLSIE
jgi:hypothetical protein